MSTVKANDLQNTSGGIPTVKGDRLIPSAWVNFNASTNVLNDSENVSSVTDVELGKHTVNFSNSLTNTGYATSITGSVNSSTATWCTTGALNNYDASKLVSSVSVSSATNSNNRVDSYDMSVIILGGY